MRRKAEPNSTMRRLGEGRMHGIGGAQYSRAERTLTPLSSVSIEVAPQHEAVAAARDHIKRPAADGSGAPAATILPRRSRSDDLALTAAQVVLPVAREKRHGNRSRRRRDHGLSDAVEFDCAAGGKTRVQFRQHPARLDMAFIGIDRPSRKRPPSDGSISSSALASSRLWPVVRRAKRSKSARSRGCATTSEPLNGVSGTCSRQSSSERITEPADQGFEVSASHQGASMPPAQ